MTLSFVLFEGGEGGKLLGLGKMHKTLVNISIYFPMRGSHFGFFRVAARSSNPLLPGPRSPHLDGSCAHIFLNIFNILGNFLNFLLSKECYLLILVKNYKERKLKPKE